MNKAFLIIGYLLLAKSIFAVENIDSLNNIIRTTTNDTIKAQTYYQLAEYYKKNSGKSDYILRDSIIKECYNFSEQALLRNKNKHVIRSLHKTLGEASVFLISTLNTSKKNSKVETYFKSCITHFKAINLRQEQCDCMRDFGKYLMVNGQENRAVFFFNKVEEIELYNGDYLNLAGTLENKGAVYLQIGKINEARTSFNKSLMLLKKLGNQKYQVNLYNHLGNVYSKEGKYVEAANHFYKALEYEKLNEDLDSRAASLNNLSIVYKNQRMYNKALEFALKALEICEKIDNREGIGYINNSIAILYSKLKQHKKSIEYYKKSLAYFNEHGNPIEISRIKLNMANSNLRIKNATESEKIFDEVLAIAKQIQNEMLIAQAKNGLVSVYFLQGKTKRALVEAKKSRQLLKKFNRVIELKMLEDLLSEIYVKEKNWKAAYNHLKNYITLNDSMTNSEVQHQIVQKEAAYQIQKNKDSTRLVVLEKEKENLKHESKIKTLEKEKRIKNFIIYSIAAGGLLIILVAYFWYKSYNIKKQHKELEMQQEINLKMKEIDILQTSLKVQSNKRSLVKANILDGSINQYLSSPLSNRELEVLSELCKGLDNQKIANTLFISVNTVRTHLSKIYEKLEVENRMQAVYKTNDLRKNK